MGISPRRYTEIGLLRVHEWRAIQYLLVPCFRVPRSREVGQPFLLSVPTTLYALLFASWSVYVERPDVVLCNGQGLYTLVLFSAQRKHVLWDTPCGVGFSVRRNGSV
jgi:hypothetical protein